MFLAKRYLPALANAGAAAPTLAPTTLPAAGGAGSTNSSVAGSPPPPQQAGTGAAGGAGGPAPIIPAGTGADEILRARETALGGKPTDPFGLNHHLSESKEKDFVTRGMSDLKGEMSEMADLLRTHTTDIKTYVNSMQQMITALNRHVTERTDSVSSQQNLQSKTNDDLKAELASIRAALQARGAPAPAPLPAAAASGDGGSAPAPLDASANGSANGSGSGSANGIANGAAAPNGVSVGPPALHGVGSAEEPTLRQPIQTAPAPSPPPPQVAAANGDASSGSGSGSGGGGGGGAAASTDGKDTPSAAMIAAMVSSSPYVIEARDALKAAIQFMQASNSSSDLRQSASSIIMYFTNCLDENKESTYRRMGLTAPLYLRLKKAIGAEKVLLAAGCEISGNNMEWSKVGLKPPSDGVSAEVRSAQRVAVLTEAKAMIELGTMSVCVCVVCRLCVGVI